MFISFRYITRSEFVVGQGKVGTTMEQKAEMAFKLMDRSFEYSFFVLAVFIISTNKLTDKQVYTKLVIDMLTIFALHISAVFARNDKDGDGKLSKEEFKEMMCRVKK